MKPNFITKKESTVQVLVAEWELGYIKNGAFFPKENMMFKPKWLIEIGEFMQKNGNYIDFPDGIRMKYSFPDIECQPSHE